MKPTRISQLPTLGRCPGLLALQMNEDSTSKAAQTGSAAHKAIELFHRGACAIQPRSDGVKDSDWALAPALAAEFPLADPDLAGRLTRSYARDARNWTDVLPEYLEAEVTFCLSGIQLVGHVDQIRRTNGQLYVWDVKTGRADGEELVNAHAWQLAAYAIAATATLGEPVLPGGIIRLRSYVARGAPDPGDCNVFYHTPWSLAQCGQMLVNVSKLVSMLEGFPTLTTPGSHCRFCPAGGPATCVEEIEEMYENQE